MIDDSDDESSEHSDDESPPNEPPELRELVEVQFSTFGSQRLQRLSSDSTIRITIRMTMMGMMPMLRAAVKGAASLRLSRSFLSSSLKALAIVSLTISVGRVRK